MPRSIQYCSDLHLEFEKNRKWLARHPLEVKADVLLLGGDIMLFSQLEQYGDFLDWVSSNYSAAYWIPGNHEYYNSDIAEAYQSRCTAIRDNVHLVNNATISLGDTDLICSTFWSHIHPASEMPVQRAMSDFRLIKNGGRRLNIADYNQLHEQASQFITSAVQASLAPRKIVLTHHVPTFMNYPPKFLGDPLNEAFATEMHDFILNSGVSAWLYGHTHCNTPDFRIGDTQMLTNQLGYVQYGENAHFNRGKVIVV